MLIIYRRDIIIKILQERFAALVSKNVKIYDIDEANLKGFTTTEKDKKRGVDRMPPVNFRNRATDILPEAVEET